MKGKLTSRRKAHHRRQAGQAMVEFMLVVIFLFLLFVSILQMILFMYAYTTLADAAKEGVRYAIVHGTGNSICSGPGNPISSPVITCTDPNGTNVVTAVTNFAGLSFQSISATNNGCTSNANGVNVCYDPNNANSGSTFGAACSAPGCLVRVTVSHVYTPFFGLPWPNFTLYAAADGRIMN
jgi:TadE-like protein